MLIDRNSAGSAETLRLTTSGSQQQPTTRVEIRAMQHKTHHLRMPTAINFCALQFDTHWQYAMRTMSPSAWLCKRILEIQLEWNRRFLGYVECYRCVFQIHNFGQPSHSAMIHSLEMSAGALYWLKGATMICYPYCAYPTATALNESDIQRWTNRS